MWASWFQGNSHTTLALLAMAFFVAAFATILLRTFRGGAGHFDARARLPLEDSGVSHD